MLKILARRLSLSSTEPGQYLDGGTPGTNNRGIKPEKKKKKKLPLEYWEGVKDGDAYNNRLDHVLHLLGRGMSYSDARRYHL